MKIWKILSLCSLQKKKEKACSRENPKDTAGQSLNKEILDVTGGSAIPAEARNRDKVIA